MNVSLKKLSKKSDIRMTLWESYKGKINCARTCKKRYIIIWIVGSSGVSWLLLLTCTVVPDSLLKHILGKRAWGSDRFQDTFSNDIREAAASALRKIKGERGNVYCPSAKGTNRSSYNCLHATSTNNYCCSYVIRKLEISVYPFFSDCGVRVQDYTDAPIRIWDCISEANDNLQVVINEI